MDSAFNSNLRAIIFIVGLVIAQFIGIGMRYVIPKNKKPWILEGRAPNDTEKAAHDVCDVFEDHLDPLISHPLHTLYFIHIH